MRLNFRPKILNATANCEMASSKHTEFQTYKLRDERSYTVVLKNTYYSINPNISKLKSRN
jgi:hypothetical protein